MVFPHVFLQLQALGSLDLRLQVLYLGHHQRPPGELGGPRALLPLEGRGRDGHGTEGGDQSHQDLERGEAGGCWRMLVKGKEIGLNMFQQIGLK